MGEGSLSLRQVGTPGVGPLLWLCTAFHASLQASRPPPSPHPHPPAAPAPCTPTQVFEEGSAELRVPLTTRSGTKDAGEIWISLRKVGGWGAWRAWGPASRRCEAGWHLRSARCVRRASCPPR